MGKLEHCINTLGILNIDDLEMLKNLDVKRAGNGDKGEIVTNDSKTDTLK